MSKTLITNIAPAEDAKVKAAMANITNAVKEAVKAGIEAAFDEADDGKGGVQNQGAPFFDRRPASGSGLSAFKLPKAEG